MFRDPCETRVFGDPCVGREGERLVCYRNRVLLARSCVQRVRECVTVVCSDLLSVWAAGTVRSLLSKSELQNVIGAQCTYGPLNDMGRCKQSTCDPRRRLGGMGWGCDYLVWKIAR